MFKLLALNETSQGTSSSDKPLRDTKEAQEAQAFKLYNEALRLQQIDCRDEAVQVYEQLLKTPLVVESATTLVNEHNEAIEHPLKDSGLILKYSAHKNVASICASKGDKKKAMENYLQAVMLDTSDVALWYKIGILAANLSNLHLSRRALTQGLECNPNHWPCLDSLISVCYALLDYENCLRWISKALSKDSFYKKGIFLRRKMIKECPHLQRDFDYIFKNCGSQVFELEISEEDGDEFLKEAITLRENFRKLCIPQEIPIIPLQVPLKSLSWLNLGKSLIATYEFIETQEEPISITSPIDMKVFDEKRVESSVREVIHDVQGGNIENLCGKSQDKPCLTDSDSKSNCATYEAIGVSNFTETSNGSKVSNEPSADVSSLTKSKKAVKRKKPPEKVCEQGRRSERRSSRMKPRLQYRCTDEPSPSPDLDFRSSLLKLLPKTLQINLKALPMDMDSDTNSQDSSIICSDQPLSTASSLTANSDTVTVKSFQNDICLAIGTSQVQVPDDDSSKIVAGVTEILMVDSSQQSLESSNIMPLTCTSKSDSVSVQTSQSDVRVIPMPSQVVVDNCDKISVRPTENEAIMIDISDQKSCCPNIAPHLCTNTSKNSNTQTLQNDTPVSFAISGEVADHASNEMASASNEVKVTEFPQANPYSTIAVGGNVEDTLCESSMSKKLRKDSSGFQKEISDKLVNTDQADEDSGLKISRSETTSTLIRKVSKRELEEKCRVRKFIEKHNDTNNGILNLFLMFCKSIGRLSHLPWEHGLKEVFLKAFDIMQPSLRVEPFIKCKLSVENKISFAYYMLTHLECSLDCKYTKHSNNFTYFPSELEYRDMGFIIDASYHPEVLELDTMPQYRFKNFVLRFHWVRANYFFLSGDKRSVIGELTMCSKLCMDMEIKLHHLENHNIINLETINKRINSLKRFQLLEEIEHLLECEDYAEALKLLKSNMKSSEQYLQEICASIPGDNSVALERPKLLNYLIKASVGLGDMPTLYETLLNCLHESVCQLPYLHVKKSPKETKCYDSWRTLYTMCCSSFAGIVEKDKDVLKAISKDALSTLIHDLISLNHYHLLNFPTKSQSLLKGSYFEQVFTPWVLLFHATKFAEEGFSGKSGVGNLPSCAMILISAHDWFGEKGYCCANNGILLRILLKELVEHFDEVNGISVSSSDKQDVGLNDSEKSRDASQNSLNIATCIEQCFYCLFGYPNKLSKSSRLHDHGSQSLSLKWEDAFLLYKYFKPICLPAFDSYKVNTILNDVAGLLQKILKIVPDKMQEKLTRSLKVLDAYLKAEDITKDIEIESVCAESELAILSDIYYLLADYYFKNKDMPQAGKYYMYDICINPGRFDSWAALALVKSSILDQRIRLCSSKLHNQVTGKEESILAFSKSTLFCFKKAMTIEDCSTTLWIEYGTFAYWIHAYFSRQIKMKKHASEEAVALWKKKKASMLNQAETCFESALSCDSDDISSEEWLILYMLGKVQEKKLEPPRKFLPHYSRAASLLHQKHAKYPKKIQFKSYQTDYAIESLEIYFRIHCSIMKLVKHEINVVNGFDDGEDRKPLTKEDFDLISDIMEEAESSNFVRRESLQSQQLYEKPPDSNSKKAITQTKLSTSMNESHTALSMGSLVPDAIVSALSSQLTSESSSIETDCTVSTQQSGLNSDSISTRQHLLSAFEKELSSEHLSTKEVMPATEESAPLTKDNRLQFCSKTLKSCVSALHLCLNRLPQHYKAIYRLADLYWRCPPDSQHLSWCCDLILGSSSPWQNTAHMPCQGLLSERNKTNLFNGVWKIPVDEIDRPGSFGYHLYRCIVLLLDVLLSLNDHRKLFYLHNMLNRTPDQGRKYLKDTDRVLVSKKSLSYCIKALYNKVSSINASDCASLSERLQYLMDAAKICQQKQRMSDPAEDILPKQQTEMHKELLILSYEKYIVGLPPITTPLPNLDFIPAVVKVERILKFCQQHTSLFPSTPKSHLSSFSQQFDFNMADISTKHSVASTVEKDIDSTKADLQIDDKPNKSVKQALDPDRQHSTSMVSSKETSNSDKTKKTTDPAEISKNPLTADIYDVTNRRPANALACGTASVPESASSKEIGTSSVLTHESPEPPLKKSKTLISNIEIQSMPSNDVHVDNSFIVSESKKALEVDETDHIDLRKPSHLSDDTSKVLGLIGSTGVETSTSIQSTTTIDVLETSLVFDDTSNVLGFIEGTGVKTATSTHVTTIASGSLLTTAEIDPLHIQSISPNVTTVTNIGSTFNQASIRPKAEVTTVTQGDRTYTKIIPCRQNPGLSPSPHSAFTPRNRSTNLQILKINRDNKGLLERSTSLPETSKMASHKNLHRTGSISEYTKQRLKSSILMKTSASLVKKPSITENEIDQILCDIESSQSEEEEDAETMFQPLTAAPSEASAQSPCHPIAITPVGIPSSLDNYSDDT